MRIYVSLIWLTRIIQQNQHMKANSMKTREIISKYVYVHTYNWNRKCNIGSTIIVKIELSADPVKSTIFCSD